MAFQFARLANPFFSEPVPFFHTGQVLKLVISMGSCCPIGTHGWYTRRYLCHVLGSTQTVECIWGRDLNQGLCELGPLELRVNSAS